PSAVCVDNPDRGGEPSLVPETAELRRALVELDALEHDLLAVGREVRVGIKAALRRDRQLYRLPGARARLDVDPVEARVVEIVVFVGDQRSVGGDRRDAVEPGTGALLAHVGPVRL